MDNVNAGGTVETPNVEELQERLKKAEAKIVEMKKSSDPKEAVEEKKEEAVDLDKKISDMLEAKFNSLNKKEEYKKAEDIIEANQETTNSMSISWDENVWGSWFKWVSLSDFDKMTPNQKREYITESANTNWEVVFL